MNGLDQNEQIALLAKAATIRIEVEIECSDCGTTFDCTFAPHQAGLSGHEAADEAWDEGWEVHEGKVLCSDCSPEDEADREWPTHEPMNYEVYP